MTKVNINQQDSTPRINETGELVYAESSNTLFIKTIRNGVRQIGITNEQDPLFTAWLAGPPNISTFVNDVPYLSTVAVDGVTITGDGTIANPLVAVIPVITSAALTKTDDTNVTLTLGGSPNTSLLAATSLTLGWTGTLADSRIASASTWNGKQNALSGTGIVKSTAGTISYLTDNTTNWDTAYTNRITSLTTTGSGAATLLSNVLNIPTPPSATFTSLTTTGSSGASTLLSGVLNVPTYTLSGLGGEPTITGGTTAQYWRGDKTWQTFPTIPTVGTWGALNYPTWSSGTPFVKMTAAGTFALDTNTYLTTIPISTSSVLGGVKIGSGVTVGIDGTISVSTSYQAPLSGTGIVKSTAGTISYLTDNTANWDSAYTNRITSLTTTGSSGASTLISNVLNIPTYTADGILPSQTSNSGKYLTTNGTTASWATVVAAASLSSLTAATATNTIANGTYLQTWNWANSGTSIGGLSINIADTTTTEGTTGIPTTAPLFVKRTGTITNANYSYAAAFINESTGNLQQRGVYFRSAVTGSTTAGASVVAENAIHIVKNSGISNGLYFGTINDYTGDASIIRAFNVAQLTVKSPASGTIYIYPQSTSGTYIQSSTSEIMNLGIHTSTKSALGFGTDFTSGSYRAQTTTAAVIERNSDALKFSANSGLSGGYAGFTPTFQLNIVGSTNNVGIGTTTPVVSAALEISSTTKGFLSTRWTTTQMNAISSPATGLSGYNTDAKMTVNYNGSAYTSIGVVSYSYSGIGTATTTFTVTFGGTQPNTTYKVVVTPTSTLALGGYVNNKTTTTFDYVLPVTTGTVTFDCHITQ